MIRSRVARGPLLGGLLFSVLSLAACGQDVNERCQLDSDCQSGLICVLGANDRVTGGTCQSTQGSDMASTADFTIPIDFTTVD